MKTVKANDFDVDFDNGKDVTKYLDKNTSCRKNTKFVKQPSFYSKVFLNLYNWLIKKFN